jgi:hypothetical protein
MKTRVIAVASILGLGVVTFALAQQVAGQAPRRTAPADATAPRSSDKPRDDRSELHAAVARLRAEVELLQLEHDLARDRLSAVMKQQVEEGIESDLAQYLVRDSMKMGAELVGRGSEFEAATQQKGGEIQQAVNKAVAAWAPADIDRLKRDFLRVATELNRKKIDLVSLEIHLEGSM